MSVKGIDISSNNGRYINFAKIRLEGYRFVLIKATEGVHYQNPYASQHTREAKAAGLIPGAYGFTSPKSTNSGQAEADYFVEYSRHCGLLEKHCLRPCADIEATKLGKGRPSRRYDYGFIERVSRHLGPGTFNAFDGKPFIYTGSWFWDGILGARNAHGCPLWLAAYTSSWKNLIPKAFIKGVSIHQYTDKGKIPGVNGYYDLDRYLGKNVNVLEHLHTLRKSI